MRRIPASRRSAISSKSHPGPSPGLRRALRSVREGPADSGADDSRTVSFRASPILGRKGGFFGSVLDDPKFIWRGLRQPGDRLTESRTIPKASGFGSHCRPGPRSAGMSRAPSLDLRVWVLEAVPGSLGRRLVAARLGVGVAVSAAVADGHALRANNKMTANVQGLLLWLEGVDPSLGRVGSSADLTGICARGLRAPDADPGDRLAVRSPTYDATTISVVCLNRDVSPRGKPQYVTRQQRLTPSSRIVVARQHADALHLLLKSRGITPWLWNIPIR